MELSDFFNGYTFVSLYSQSSLSSHSVRVALKNVALHKKLCYVDKKKYVAPKRDSRWLNMFSIAQKRNTSWQKKFMLYINICCIDYKNFVLHEKYFDVAQKLKLVCINFINFINLLITARHNLFVQVDNFLTMIVIV